MEAQYIKKKENGTYYYSDESMTTIHREDGPAIEYVDGSTYWYKDGLRHREDGPAGEYKDGTKLWYQNGKRHREDGPAAEYSDGFTFWFLDDVQYSETEYNSKMNGHDGTVVVVDGIKYELKLKS